MVCRILYPFSAEQEIFYYFYQKLNGEFIFDVDLFTRRSTVNL